MRLTSCCRALRAGTLSNRRLWGSLQPDLCNKPSACFNSLAAWLAAHKSGLHTLWLDVNNRLERAVAAAVPGLLRSMAGGTLAALQLCRAPAGAGLQALGELQLTRLNMSECGTEALPDELVALPLAQLELTNCERLGLKADSALAPLARLGASLTSLKLVHCGLAGRVPAPLRALSEHWSWSWVRAPADPINTLPRHPLRMPLLRWPALRP